MQTSDLQALFSLQNYSMMMQILVLVIQGIYVLFAFMLTRQIKIMNKNFQTNMAGFFTVLGNLHLLGALVILAISILVL